MKRLVLLFGIIFTMVLVFPSCSNYGGTMVNSKVHSCQSKKAKKVKTHKHHTKAYRKALRHKR
jgi:hypothetical protein